MRLGIDPHVDLPVNTIDPLISPDRLPIVNVILPDAHNPGEIDPGYDDSRNPPRNPPPETLVNMAIRFPPIHDPLRDELADD